MGKPGRPPGRILHADALEAILAVKATRKRDFCTEAGISATFLSDLLAHRGGATVEVSTRMADALGVQPSVIFPELAGWVSPLPDRDGRRKRVAA